MNYIIMDNEDGLVAYIDIGKGEVIIEEGYKISEITDTEGESVKMPNIEQKTMEDYKIKQN